MGTFLCNMDYKLLLKNRLVARGPPLQLATGAMIQTLMSRSVCPARFPACLGVVVLV